MIKSRCFLRVRTKFNNSLESVRVRESFRHELTDCEDFIDTPGILYEITK